MKLKTKTSYLFYNLLIIKAIFILHYFLDLNKLSSKKNDENNTIMCLHKDKKITDKKSFYLRNYWILYYFYFISFLCFMKIKFL